MRSFINNYILISEKDSNSKIEEKLNRIEAIGKDNSWEFSKAVATQKKDPISGERALLSAYKKMISKLMPPKPIPAEVIDLLSKIGPEIDPIYSSIKQIGFRNTDTDLMNAALKAYDNNQREYEYLKREYLKKCSYRFPGGQEPRTFYGKLFQKAVMAQGFGEFDFTLLYKEYISQKPKNS